MTLRKLIVLGALSISGVSHAAPASLTLSLPSELFVGRVSMATVTVNTGSGVLGAADFLITYDTAAVHVSSVGVVNSFFQGTTYIDSSIVGRIHILALNGASLTSPTGSVDVATLMFTPTHPGAGVIDAQVNLVIDTEPVAYTPVTVSPGHFNALADFLPPRTTLTAGTPHSGVDPLIISSATLLSLSAVDDATLLGDAVGAGVVETRYAIDGGVFIPYTEPFVVTTSGSHIVSYFSTDRLGQVEIQKDTAILVVNATPPPADTVPPESTLVLGSPMRQLIFGIYMVTRDTPLSLRAIDPEVQGAASGVQDSWVAIDAGAFQQVNGTFFLTSARNGLHLLRYYSRDNASNVETAHLALVIVLPNASSLVGARSLLPAGVGASQPLGTGESVSASPAYIEGTSTVTYHLEFARGLNAQNGFTPMSLEWGLLDPAATTLLNPRSAGSAFTVRLRTAGADPVDSANVVADPALVAALLGAMFGRAPALADFVQRETFVFPNPARAGVQPTLHVEVGIADEVRIRIFDAAGRELQEVTLTGAPTLINSQYAYEYVWGGSVPSGVYFYAIRARKAGADDIQVKGKFAVVR